MVRYRLSITMVITVALFALLSAQSDDTSVPVRIWYGADQKFGELGQPQRWVNVLGNVQMGDLELLTFRLNGSGPDTLATGPDLHRLAASGDFNIELAWEQLQAGANQLLVTARSSTGQVHTTETQMNVTKGQTWPLPYHVDFRAASDLQQVVQIVDGLWELTPEGAHTVVPYYDRVLCMGDTSWRDYEATILLTIHGWTPSQPGPPTYNVSHFGVAMRWRGHQADGLQPSRKWFPLGAQGEFLLKQEVDSCQWRILFDGTKDKPPRYAGGRNSLQPGIPLWVKTQVNTMPDGRTRYRFKQWPEGQPEPWNWDVEGFEDDDYSSGALCLVPHNSDVTIHSVRVEPLRSTARMPEARPGPGALHESALIGGTMGSRGVPFKKEVFLPGDRLLSISVLEGDPPLSLILGIRFLIERDGEMVQYQIGGAEHGTWTPDFMPEGNSALLGISGASGWYLDAIQFHFADGSTSPRYGGPGGDTEFHLGLRPGTWQEGARIRGFYGTAANEGLETLGLIFDPGK